MQKLSVVLVFFVAVLLLTFTVAPIAAQESGTTPAVRVNPEVTPANRDIRPQWGTAHESVKRVSALAFVPLHSTSTYDFTFQPGYGPQRYCTGGGECVFESNVDLPSGALITGIEIDGCDTSATAEITLNLDKNVLNGINNSIANTHSGVAAAPGCTSFQTSLTTPETVDNYHNSYFVEVYLGNNDMTTTFKSVLIYYQLQISPAPGTATFNDVPTSHPFFQYIEALYASGITTGCPYPNFCPDMAVTRGQMATFLSRALGLYWSNQ